MKWNNGSFSNARHGTQFFQVAETVPLKALETHPCHCDILDFLTSRQVSWKNTNSWKTEGLFEPPVRTRTKDIKPDRPCKQEWEAHTPTPRPPPRRACPWPLWVMPLRCTCLGGTKHTEHKPQEQSLHPGSLSSPPPGEAEWAVCQLVERACVRAPLNNIRPLAWPIMNQGLLILRPWPHRRPPRMSCLAGRSFSGHPLFSFEISFKRNLSWSGHLTFRVSQKSQDNRGVLRTVMFISFYILRSKIGQTAQDMPPAHVLFL